jgi:hypothetical protein
LNENDSKTDKRKTLDIDIDDVGIVRGASDNNTNLLKKNSKESSPLSSPSDGVTPTTNHQTEVADCLDALQIALKMAHFSSDEEDDDDDSLEL